MVGKGGRNGGVGEIRSTCHGRWLNQRTMLHQRMVVVPNEVRVEGREAVNGRRSSCHGHCQRRHSHIVGVNVCMCLRAVPGNRSSPQLSCSASDEHDVIA